MNRISGPMWLCAAIALSGCSAVQTVTPSLQPGAIASPSATAAPSPTGSAPAAIPSPATSPSSAATPMAIRIGPLAAGTYTWMPSQGEDGWSACPQPAPSGCSDPVEAGSIRFTFTVPDGWQWTPGISPVEVGFEGPNGASLGFGRGSWLHSNPCRNDDLQPEVPVGPTVDDFAQALADSQVLDVSAAADVTLGGHTGQYVELQVPSDISGCEFYWPWEPGIYAQGPSHLWRLWILDVDGVRVVVQAGEFPGTSEQHRAELQAIVDSLRIS